MDNADDFEQEEKETDISEDKVYRLPFMRIVKYKDYYLAIAVNIARWLVLTNEVQLKILDAFQNKKSVGEVLEKFGDYQEDIINVLTQIEATHLETLKPKSVFLNTRLHLHLTNNCNLCCPHCYMESGQPYEQELTTKEIKELCKHFLAFGGTDVSLTGGEPTMRPDFFEIVEYISKLGMRVAVFSNGVFWDETNTRRLSEYNVEGIQISIDGFNEETNAIIRGKGVFDKALRAVDLFVKYKIFVKIAITAPYDVLREHQQEYISFSKMLLNKYGEDAIEINYSYFFMPGRHLTYNEINKTRSEYYQLVDHVVTAIYGDTTEDTFVSNIIDSIYDSCGFGGLNVMANGDFFFCDRIPDVNKGGNIRNTSINQIHSLMKIAEKAGKIDNFKPCGSCELKYICGGGCRAEHFRLFTKAKDIRTVDFEKIPPRECNQTQKDKFYDLMVRTFERFYA